MNKSIFSKSRLIAWIMIFGFVVSLAPICAVSFYNHPSADDYGYSAGVHHAIISGGGVAEICKAVADTVAETYFDWQGTFSAIAIFAMQPGGGGDG